jgi:hypothetical protein
MWVAMVARQKKAKMDVRITIVYYLARVECRIGTHLLCVSGFAEAGTINLGGLDIAYDSIENINGRNIQGFSTNTDKHRINGEGAFYPDFNMFQEYYGTTSYADDWIVAALSKGATEGFSNGSANFKSYSDQGRVRK